MKINTKISKVFLAMLVFGVLMIGQVFAAATDDFEIGTQNLNNTSQNSAKIGDELLKPEKGWKRYDDANSKIIYDNIPLISNSNYYKGATHHKNNFANCTVKFNFTGSKIRIVSVKHNTTYDGNINVNIDGISYSYSQGQNGYFNNYQSLLFEKLGLENREHQVVITSSSSSQYFNIDAIDIDQNGELKQYGSIMKNEFEIGTQNLNNTLQNSAKVGVSLTKPEKGWKRYDDSNEKISYVGTWQFNPNYTWGSIRVYKDTLHGVDNRGKKLDKMQSIKFNFVGTKLRVMTFAGMDRPNNNQIFIDNERYIFNSYTSKYVTEHLSFEKVGLENKEHNVEIIVGSGDYEFPFDAIDIDSEGELKLYGSVQEDIKASSLELNKTSSNLEVGNKEALTATVKPDNTTNKSVKWTTSDASIATVDQNGKVTAVKAGTATIAATTQDGSNLSASCNVTITEPVDSEDKLATSITLNKASLKVDVDKTALIGAIVKPDDVANKTVKWVSSDTSIAIVYSNGKVKGVKPGKVTITATTKDGSNLSATCEVTVIGMIETPITLNKTSLEIDVNETSLIEVILKPDDSVGNAVNWTSSDPSIAIVYSNGKVKGINPGKVTITATGQDGSGLSATCEVTVR